MIKMIPCNTCEGSGAVGSGSECVICGGIGRVAQRQKVVIPSDSPKKVYFRGALINQRHKGTK
jgi:DnaJ-class molecular chaperone